MKFFLTELIFFVFALGVAHTPRCFNLRPLGIAGSIKNTAHSFYGTLNVVGPSDGTEAELFLSCSSCKSSHFRVCDCKIVTKLSIGFGALRGVAFAYGEINFGQHRNTLIIAGAGDGLVGGYGTFAITKLHVYSSRISFTAKVDPCIFGGVNPFLPRVHITADANVQYTAHNSRQAIGSLSITCGSGRSKMYTLTANQRKHFSIDCIPGESLTVKAKAFSKRGIAVKVHEKIKYGVLSCIRDDTECTYRTTVLNFDTRVVCTFRAIDLPKPPTRPPISPPCEFDNDILWHCFCGNPPFKRGLCPPHF